MNSSKSPTCIELFCGAGGLGLGLGQAGFRVVAANDHDEDACASFAANHPGTRVVNGPIQSLDLTELVRDTLPQRLDLLAGGPPCQGFSTVGAKRERDGRNSLFLEYIRAVRELEPRYLLFENVSGFKRMYQGRVFEALVNELDALGYRTDHAILDAASYGVPQHRLRTVILAWRHDESPAQFPQPTHANTQGALFHAEHFTTLIDAISDLPELVSGESIDEYASEPLNEYQSVMRDDVETLTEHNASNYGARMREILAHIPPGGCVDDLPERLRPKSYFGNTYARLRPEEPAPTITRNFGTPSSSRCVHPFQDRALSTREGARLQGFPDSYVFKGSKGSKNLQIGNAVPPPLARAIGHALIEAIMGFQASETNAAASLSIRLAKPVCSQPH